MKKKPTSAKKHKGLRRPRRVNWNESRRQMELREKLLTEAIKDVNPGIEV